MLEEYISTKRPVFSMITPRTVILVIQKKVELHFINPYSSLNHSNYDFSLFCNKILSKNQISDVLNKVWAREINYKFPIKSITSGKDKKVKNLKF
jgi:hypothetical protein